MWEEPFTQEIRPSSIWGGEMAIGAKVFQRVESIFLLKRSDRLTDDKWCEEREVGEGGFRPSDGCNLQSVRPSPRGKCSLFFGAPLLLENWFVL